jgi:hypothetical protein
MHNDVTLGLTAVQAEYLRGIVDSEGDRLAKRLGKTIGDDMSQRELEWERGLTLCEVIVSKLTSAIAIGIRHNREEQMR